MYSSLELSKSKSVTIVTKDSVFFARSEEQQGKGVLAFLGEFFFHAVDGGLEEEGDEELVCAFCADLLEG